MDVLRSCVSQYSSGCGSGEGREGSL